MVHPAPLNTPQQSQHHSGSPGLYNLPGPPIDPNSIFGNPMGQPALPAWNSQPAFPNQNMRGNSNDGGRNGGGNGGGTFSSSGGLGSGGNGNGQSSGGYVYPQIPQSQPMYPYAMPPPPFNPPSQQQQPYAFGNPPPPRNYPTYYVTTTKEPSLWHQFLNNKQQAGKKNAAMPAAMRLSLGMFTIAVAVAASTSRWWC